MCNCSSVADLLCDMRRDMSARSHVNGQFVGGSGSMAEECPGGLVSCQGKAPRGPVVAFKKVCSGLQV